MDQLGLPISLSLAKEMTHKTVLGGCCSLCAITLIVVILVAQISNVFFAFNYTQTETLSYLRLNDGHTPYNVSTDEVIPAISLGSLNFPNSSLVITDYMRFYAVKTSTVRKENGTYVYETISEPLLPCAQVYSPNEYPDTLTKQFMNSINPEVAASTEWFCLQPQTYGLLNDPWTMPESYNVALSVDFCDIVA